MDVTQPAALAPMQNGGRPPPRGQGSPGISSDFQTFLRMLTAQLQNQNPLEPIEASDFAVQLATFSGVEQQVRTNELLSQLTTRMGLAELGTWVGREALSAAPQYFGTLPVQLVIPPNTGADRAELVLRGADGAEIRRLAIDPNAADFTLEPRSVSEGGPPPGFYTVERESFRAGALTSVDPVQGYAQIIEARKDGDALMLVLAGGYRVTAEEITGLRN